MLYSDMYFETSNDYVSIDEMLEGDIKYSLELGLELKDNFTTGLAASGGGLGPCSDDSLDLSLDLVAVDASGPGLMVNPKSVIPAKPYYNYHVQVKRELKAEDETGSEFSIAVKSEPQEPEENEFDDDVSDSDVDTEEMEDVKPSSVWSSIQKTEDLRNVKILVEPNDLPDSKLSMGIPVPFATLVPNRRPQLKMEPTFIKVKSIDALVNKQINRDYAQLNNKSKVKSQQDPKNVIGEFKSKYPKPAFSYSCLIAMALKNSRTGSLPVSDIYNFMCFHFPYFKSAPSGWKNSVRHNLSLNKCFEKIEKNLGVSNASCRKGCLWAMNPAKITKMDDEVAKWSKKDPLGIRRSMRFPDNLEKLEKGVFVNHDADWDDNDMIKMESVSFPQTEINDDEISNEEDNDGEIVEENAVNESEDEEEEDDRVISTNSDSEDEGEVPPSLKPFDSRLADSSSDIGIDLSDEMKEELGFLEEVVSNEEVCHMPKRQRLIMGPSDLRRPVGTA